jgi:hypothetical protein
VKEKETVIDSTMKHKRHQKMNVPNPELNENLQQSADPESLVTWIKSRKKQISKMNYKMADS